MHIIAEIGINHSGDLQKAKSLIKDAKLSGCWGVKFQYRNLESFYQSINEIGDGILFEDLEKCHFSDVLIHELREFAQALNLKAGISFFKTEDIITFKNGIGDFDFFKVPSAECLNIPLLKKLLSFKKTVLVSTGGHDFADVVSGLSKFKEQISIFHCIANYPTKAGSQQFNVINHFKKNGFKSVGYSSHDEDYEACVLAMSFGLDFLERHITYDKNADGLDHSSSSTLKEFSQLVKFSKNIKYMLADEKRYVNQGEKINMQNLGCGLYLRKNVRAGTVLKKHDLEIKAPRLGISLGEFLAKFQKIGLASNVSCGDYLKASDFEGSKLFEQDKLTYFAKKNNISLPVRLHDFEVFDNIFRLSNYEFHLSYQEILKGDFQKVLPLLDSKKEISIHLPDYIPGNQILDPISVYRDIRGASLQIIDMTQSFAKKIYYATGNKVKIIGSFSRINKNKLNTLELINEFVKSRETLSYEILPQWLPGFAWYFGGSERLKVFNDRFDVDFIKKNNLPICLDLCHLGMSANSNSGSFISWFNELAPFTRHMHLADYRGEDGEGLQIGDGEIENFDRILQNSNVKVLEVWQGHLNCGYAFKEAISRLKKMG